jgi:hypothetical protein
MYALFSLELQVKVIETGSWLKPPCVAPAREKCSRVVYIFSQTTIGNIMILQ